MQYRDVSSSRGEIKYAVLAKLENLFWAGIDAIGRDGLQPDRCGKLSVLETSS